MRVLRTLFGGSGIQAAQIQSTKVAKQLLKFLQGHAHFGGSLQLRRSAPAWRLILAARPRHGELAGEAREDPNPSGVNCQESHRELRESGVRLKLHIPIWVKFVSQRHQSNPQSRREPDHRRAHAKESGHGFAARYSALPANSLAEAVRDRAGPSGLLTIPRSLLALTCTTSPLRTTEYQEHLSDHPKSLYRNRWRNFSGREHHNSWKKGFQEAAQVES